VHSLASHAVIGLRMHGVAVGSQVLTNECRVVLG
jgi:hypothetical protein